MTLGNHEIMNMCHDFRYMSDKEKDNPERIQAFSPNGRLAKTLRNYPICTKVERNVFVHGGIMPEFAKLGVDGLNKLKAETIVSYTADRWENKTANITLYGHDGPVWSRFYAKNTDPCPTLQKSLKLLDADRMVVGHTVQHNHVVNSCCNGTLILQDVAISRAMGAGYVGAVEIRGGKAMALDAQGWQTLIT